MMIYAVANVVIVCVCMCFAVCFAEENKLQYVFYVEISVNLLLVLGISSVIILCVLVGGVWSYKKTWGSVFNGDDIVISSVCVCVCVRVRLLDFLSFLLFFAVFLELDETF